MDILRYRYYLIYIYIIDIDSNYYIYAFLFDRGEMKLSLAYICNKKRANLTRPRLPTETATMTGKQVAHTV